MFKMLQKLYKPLCFKTLMDKKMVILNVFLFLLILPIVSAIYNPDDAVCFPDDPLMMCKKTYTSGDYFYCDIDDVVSCPSKLVLGVQVGGCFSNPVGSDFCATGESVADGGGEVEIPDCSEGYMRCGDGVFYNPNGDVQECVDGHWVVKEDCGSFFCIEQTFNNAYCEVDWFYCLSDQGCYLKSKDGNNCYNTLEDCNSQIGYCCYSSDDPSSFHWVKGSCNTDELYIFGSEITENSCSNRNAGECAISLFNSPVCLMEDATFNNIKYVFYGFLVLIGLGFILRVFGVV